MFKMFRMNFLFINESQAVIFFHIADYNFIYLYKYNNWFAGRVFPTDDLY